jgi:hypothetical protein
MTHGTDRRPVFFDLLRIQMPVGALTSISHRLTGVLLALRDALAFGRNERGHDLGADTPHAILRTMTCTRARSTASWSTLQSPSSGSFGRRAERRFGMQLGMIELGRIRASMVRRPMTGGHECVSRMTIARPEARQVMSEESAFVRSGPASAHGPRGNC